MSEKLKPIENKKINMVRLFADLQVCSVYRLLKEYLPVKEKRTGICLDVGCGDSPYRFLYEGYKYKGIDWNGSNESFGYKNNDTEYYDGYNFPIQSQTIDLLVHTEVAEHIQDIKHFFDECYRVMKQESVMIFSIPFSARYHYIPYDYRRLTPAGINDILTNCGFTDIKIFPRSTDITVACYKTITIGYRWLLSKNIIKILGFILFLPFFSISLFLGQISLWLDIGEKDDCLGYIVTATKKTPEDAFFKNIT